MGGGAEVDNWRMMTLLFKMVIERVPSPQVDADGPLQCKSVR